ncbi:glycosyltransferase [Marinobacter alexandrii]|uniref:glycosyltransferase n=1 Tax=Marinobacter alexandrii TaxID=2570351 RepID=UPI00110908D5|nr:glycosyltransferase [Marinobacter alexandrii]
MKPYVSVLIPAYNEEINIGKCIESIQSQTYPRDRFEVIVMDNGSVDDTRNIVKNVGVRVVNADGLLIGGVRNAGVDASIGDYLAFIDADCVANTDWLESGVGLLTASEEVGAVGGQCSVPKNATWVQRAWGFKKNDLGIRRVNILSTGSFFIERSMFFRVGGFNEQILAGEDTEISRKIIESGKKLLLSSAVGVMHLGYPSSIKEFLKRQIWQSSDYLKSTKSKNDPIFLIVHLYLLLIVLSSVALVFDWPKKMALLLFIGSVLLALLLTIYRHVKYKRGVNVLLFSQYTILNFLYLLARSFGLLRSYLRLMIQKR